MAANQKKKTVLLLTQINSHFPEMLRTADLLARFRRYRPIVLFVEGYGESVVQRSFWEHCRRENIVLMDEWGRKIRKPNQLAPSSLPPAGIFRKIIRKNSYLMKIALYFFNVFADLSYGPSLLRKKKKLQKLLGRLKPGLIVLPEDNVSYNTGIFVRWGLRHQAASVVTPFTVANEVEAAEHVKDLPQNQLKGFINRLAGRLFPKWVYRYHGKLLVLKPGWRIFVDELLKLSSPRPWMLNSGFCAAIAVESPAMMDYYRRNRLPAAQLFLTGSTSDDNLYRSLRDASAKLKEVYAELGIKNSKPMLLCAIPPPWFSRSECEFESFEEMVDFWLKTLLKAKNHNIVVSLHPRLDSTKMRYIEKYGAKISLRAVNELIPLCDFYVASISATIRWAIACGKPVINYDVYKYRFGDYRTAKGVIGVEGKKDFTKNLVRMANDKKFYAQYAGKQQKIMCSWGMLDGKSDRRILRLFDTLISQK